MTPEDYNSFKNWLLITSNIDRCPDAVSYLYAINRFLCRRIVYSDLFSLIRSLDFEEIYKCKHHKQYKLQSRRNSYYDLTVQLAFEYCDVEYENYIAYEAELSLRSFKRSHSLYIHSGNIACLRFNHPIRDVAATIAIQAPSPLRIHASFCNKCQIAFLHKAEYLRIRKKHKLLVANFIELSEDGYTPLPNDIHSDYSPLMLCGYSVKRTGPTEQERRILLYNIICNGILTRTEILQYLEHFIHYNGAKGNMTQAVAKWKSDLIFIRALDLESLPTVKVDEIKSYTFPQP